MAVFLVTALMAMATAAGVFAGRWEDKPPGGRADWARRIGYWFFTVLVAFEMSAGAIWDLLRIEYVRVVLTHLGYPLYLLLILGVWRIPGALALLVPRFPRLKEWAYAGVFFDYTGAAASHFLMGDRAGQWVGPLIFSGFTLASWALRPPSRRLLQDAAQREDGVAVWAIPVLAVVAMVAVAFLTLPKGAPPQ
jgi:hypothetical protein